MKGRVVLSAIAAFGLTATIAAAAGGEKVNWGYSGANGPENWGRLSPGYSLCASGRNQSPVNLTRMVEANLRPLGLNYSVQAMEVVNTGYTVQVNFAPGGSLEVDGRSYSLKQIHFHSPSENGSYGEFYPLEGHLVHTDAAGNMVVVAVMYVEGSYNRAFAVAWENMPLYAGGSAPLVGGSSAWEFLPVLHGYYRYNGSLTTPPCSEGVTWLVMKAPAEVSTSQLKQFQDVIGTPNSRPIQPLNSRMILE